MNHWFNAECKTEFIFSYFTKYLHYRVNYVLCIVYYSRMLMSEIAFFLEDGVIYWFILKLLIYRWTQILAWPILDERSAITRVLSSTKHESNLRHEMWHMSFMINWISNWCFTHSEHCCSCLCRAQLNQMKLNDEN